MGKGAPGRVFVYPGLPTLAGLRTMGKSAPRLAHVCLVQLDVCVCLLMFLLVCARLCRYVQVYVCLCLTVYFLCLPVSGWVCLRLELCAIIIFYDRVGPCMSGSVVCMGMSSSVYYCMCPSVQVCSGLCLSASVGLSLCPSVSGCVCLRLELCAFFIFYDHQ
jgi:hypothetical protein